MNAKTLKKVAEQLDELRAALNLLRQEFGTLTTDKSAAVWMIGHHLANVKDMVDWAAKKTERKKIASKKKQSYM